MDVTDHENLMKNTMREQSKRHSIPLLNTMRGQALVFIGAIILLVALMSGYALDRKQELLKTFTEISELEKQSRLLTRAHLTLMNALTDMLFIDNEQVNSRSEVLDKVHQHFVNLTEANLLINQVLPGKGAEFNALLENLAKTVMDPNMDLISIVLSKIQNQNQELALHLQQLQNQRAELNQAYQVASDKASMVVLAVVVISILICSLACFKFFSQLAMELEKALKQISRLVAGETLPELQTKRKDEVALLFQGVNQISQELRKRDQQLAFGRYSYFNQVRGESLRHLVGGLIHEMGNPIAAIKGLNDELLRETADNINCQLIDQQISQLEKLNNDLVSFASGSEYSTELVNLCELVQQYSYILNFDERWHRIKITVNFASNIPAVHASREQVNLLLNNICDNALTALQSGSAKQPSLTIFVENESENRVNLIVTDNGIGMAENLIQRCLEPYVTTKQHDYSAGYGLSICRSVMESLGGSIHITSQVDQGCSVTLGFAIEEQV